MTKEKILRLWGECWDGLPDTTAALDVDETIRTEVLHRYTKKLLLECAKTVCINCKEGSVSEPTSESYRRIHRLGKSGQHIEACRAPMLFLKGE